jgi:hypothetical protein
LLVCCIGEEVYECAELPARERNDIEFEVEIRKRTFMPRVFLVDQIWYCAIIVVILIFVKKSIFFIDALDMYDILLASKLRITSCFVTVDIQTVLQYV